MKYSNVNGFHMLWIITVMSEMSTIQKRHAVLTCGFVKPLDTCGTLRLSQSLRGSFAARRALGRAIVILALAMTFNLGFGKDVTQASQKPLHIMNIKLHAYNKLSWEQFQCYNYLIFKESSWNYKARNGSHTGLGQMRSEWYATLDPIRQIDVHLRYIKHRYGSACKALAHWERKGWH